MPFEKVKAAQAKRAQEGGDKQESDDNKPAPVKKEDSHDDGDDDSDSDEEEDDDDSGDSDDEDDSSDDDSKSKKKGKGGDENEALQAENKRLRRGNKAEKTDIDLPRGPGVSPAQRDLYASWTEEVKADFLEKNPQYKEKPELYKKFVEEFNDRISIIQLAKRKGVPVTKGLIAERFTSVHGSIGSNMDVERAREEGRTSAMQNSARRNIALAGSPTGTKNGGQKPQERRRVIPKQSGNITDWFPAKKT